MHLYGQKIKLLFLYSELAEYFLSCLKQLSSQYDVEVHVIHWPVNKEAPFAFAFPEGIEFYERNLFTDSSLRRKIKDINPDIIYCSGWMDKGYLSAAKGLHKAIPVIIGLDTQWEGNLKQRLACLFSPFTLKKIFTHCWIPGNRQKEYAIRLGFNASKIMTGYYVADTNHFRLLGENADKIKSHNFPRRLIYVGRYYEFKGITDLWQAFIEWKQENQNDWELWCLGTGDIEPVKHPAIKHFGFVQPKMMNRYMEQCSVFIVPSRFEPWGVVLHEFAAAGFPIVSSDAVGSAEAFMKEGVNGYIYEAGNIGALKMCLNQITSQPITKLQEMGQNSVKLAMEITPDKWARTLMALVSDKK